MLNVGTGFNGENAAKSIKEGGETLASLELKTQKASGSLSRTIELEPNRTYYYEYDTDAASDILSFSRTVTAAPGSSPRYAVAEEHIERFSKDSVSGFFTADAGGLSVLAGNGCYELGPDNAGISFSIPKGETAVLSFAYDYSLAAKTPEVSLSKGGKAYSTWNMLSCGEIGRVHPAGTYYHDALLGEGSYILYSDTKIKIDDLRIMAVEESTAAVEAGLRTLAKQSDISEGTGLKHVSGSFDTGLSTLTFDESKDAQIYTASPEGEYTSVRRTTNRKGGYTERLIYTLPQNMKAVYIRVNASQSAPRSAGDIYYYLDAARWENLEGEDDEVYIESRAVPKGKDSFSFSFKGKELVSAGGSGSSSIFSAVKRKGGALTDEFAQIDDIFMVFAKRSGSSDLTNGQFMVLGDEVLVPGASANDAVTMSFAPGKTGSTVISSLRIWFIEDGQRVYVNDTAFTDENYLTGWKAVNAYASVKHSEEQAKEQAGRVYRKGQTVLYSFSYYDYEADPEKEGYFRYTHEPMNDGLNPISGEILTEPVSKFYIDGKYTVEHWVVDDAGRGLGTEDFDYTSNVASAVFYIEGNLPENEAPVVKKIRTSPAVLNEGDGYNILVTVDDPDGDILSVKTELYFEQGSKPVYTNTKTGVKRGNGGVYPELIFTEVPDAQEGDYEVVVTVSDGKNSGIGSYSFHVDLKRTLLGDVEHTEEWETNRQDYNFRKFKDRAVNHVSVYSKYRNQQSPRKRGKNVFWTGEALQLNAEVTGDVTSVTAKMSGTSYSAALKRKGSTDIWTASMWESGMKGAFAKGGPEQKSIVFTARYKDGSTLTYTANIIFDDDELYWNLHRVN
ncbi:MAG: hypothetical protein IJK95_06320 [Firmicutes bacterium]|nr:hypothetical protein [Bacillota bacterium]